MAAQSASAFVLDASVTAAWLLPDEHSPAARHAYSKLRAATVQAHAPELWLWECGNIIANAHKHKRLSADDALLTWSVLDAVRTRVELASFEPAQTLNFFTNYTVGPDGYPVNPDPTRKLLIGFAAETNDVEKHARDKLVRKKLDMIAANEVGAAKAFDRDDNALTVISAEGASELGSGSKRALAARLVELVAARLAGAA